jgi:DNA-3-methyladenine glycosylase
VRLDAPVSAVAPTLLGCVLRANGVAVRLTEVEAYAGESDPGSHAFRGRTPRTEVMFGPPGRAYVYFTYGMHWCMNVVCGPDGVASAVLLRAGEVIEGLDLARARRPRSTDRDLARGPARLTQALGIDGSYGGVDLLDPSSPVRLTADRPVDAGAVRNGPRVGVGGDGAATPWRYWIDAEPTVSVYRPAVPRRRTVRP